MQIFKYTYIMYYIKIFHQLKNIYYLLELNKYLLNILMIFYLS